MPKTKKTSHQLQPKVSSTVFVNTLSKKDFDLCFQDATFLKAFVVSVPTHCDKFTRRVLKYLIAVPFLQPTASSPIKIDFIFSFLDKEFNELKEHNKATLPRQRAVKKIPTKANEILGSLSWLARKEVIQWDEHNYTYLLHGYIHDAIKEAKESTEFIESTIESLENNNENYASGNYMRKNSLFFSNESNALTSESTEKKTLTPKKRRSSSSPTIEGDEFKTKKLDLVKKINRAKFQFSDITLEEKTELKGEDISAKTKIPSS